MVTRVVPYDPVWKAAFEREAGAITAALSGVPIRVHHIGSTAVPGLLAKPIIDLLGEVPCLTALDDRATALDGIGYASMGAHGIDGRRYFRKSDAAGRRTHHLHIFATGSPHIERHLAFREYLIAHPKTAAAYAALKSQLTDGGAPSRGRYVDRKDPFIRAAERDALAWYREHKRD